jgi:DNA processing protein
VGVAVLGAAGYPDALAADIEPPVVLFHRGRLDVLPGPRVCIVGTRRCTRYGLDLAHELGRDLSAEGVRVVSGLALGIDGSAHRGALASDGAPPIGVVGSGLDVVYPRRHARLWADVEARGVVLSEAPLGARPERWRFPSRNRVLAALADVVVVVESHDRGGSLHTVDSALERDRPVMAVPGPVRSPASAGCNRLIAEGLHVARDAGDVLTLLGLTAAADQRRTVDPRPEPAAGDRQVLEAVGWQPVALEQIAIGTGRPLGELAAALERLAAAGWVAVNGAWYERVARPEH